MTKILGIFSEVEFKTLIVLMMMAMIVSLISNNTKYGAMFLFGASSIILIEKMFMYFEKKKVKKCRD